MWDPEQNTSNEVGLRVLLVDDDTFVLKLLTDFLEREGLTVVTVSDALQAIDAVERERFDMVVTDYNMPMMHGGQLLEQIHAQVAHRNVPVIVMSASQDPDLADRLLRAGAAYYMPKPIQFAQLLALLRFAKT
ncbi:MAG: response regulator [Deltaproteobacteria bacterium]|nr:response regulator [Deltaproteobacteria bacterium]